MDKHLLGKKIKQLRIEQGFSQEQLSELVFISPRQMCLIENGNSYPSLETFVRIAQVLRIDVNLFFDISPMQIDPSRVSIINLIMAIEKPKLPLVRDLLLAVVNN